MAGAAVSPNPIPPSPYIFPSIKPRVIILGGTGRVGASTAAALSRFCPSVRLVVAGRNRGKGTTIASKLGETTEFVQVNVDDICDIRAALEGLKKMGNELLNHIRTLLRCFVNNSDKSYGDALKVTSARLSKLDFKNQAIKNLLEVRSAHELLGIPTVSARFGTTPFFWNWGMEALASIVPANILRDKMKVGYLVRFFDPFVRAIDGIAGERVAMRVDLDYTNGRSTHGLFTHKQLSISVGSATAAFAMALLEGGTQLVVWFPEQSEGIAIEARGKLLERAAEGTSNFVMNKPPWMVETNPKEIGLGIYL